MLTDARFYLSGHRLQQAHTGLMLLCASRPFLEGHVRARVRALPNVRFLDGYDVVGLATAPDGRTGHRGAGAASGRRQRRGAAGRRPGGRRQRPRLAHTRLAGRARVPRPERDEVQIGLGYATRTYRLPPDALAGTLAVLDAATPDLPRTGAIQRLEGDRWMLTLAGILGDHPPTDPDGFLDFARSLRFPDIYEAVREAEPLDDPVGFRFPASVRHRYERLRPLPSRIPRDRRRGVQLQPDLRPGHERGRPGGAHPASPPRAGSRAAAPPLVPRPWPA